MKIISVKELMQGPQSALIANVLPTRLGNGNINFDLGSISLKTWHETQLPINNWTAVFPFDSSLLNLAGEDSDFIDEAIKFLDEESETKSIPYDPSFGGVREDDDHRVLVFEDQDIDGLLEMMMKAFPEHSARVFNKLNK